MEVENGVDLVDDRVVALDGGLDGIDGRVAGPRWDAIDEPREFGEVICPKLLAVSLKTYDG